MINKIRTFHRSRPTSCIAPNPLDSSATATVD